MSGRYTDVHGDGRHLRFTPEPAPSPAAAGLPLEDFTEAEAERLARMEIAEPAPESWSPLYEELRAEILTDMREIGYTGSWVHSAVRVLMRRERATAALAEMRPTAAEEAVRTPDDLDALPLRTRDELVAATLQWMTARGYRITHPAAPVPPDANGGEER